MARAPRTQGEKDGADAKSVVVLGHGTNEGGLIGGERGSEDDLGDENEDVYVPEGFSTVEEFLQMVMYEFDADYRYDETNILEAMEDLRFTYVDQWDPETRIEREAQGRPCLTVNTLPQFAGQVIGDRRINKTTIKVIPSRDGTVEMAKVRTGLIKSIEQQSRATRIYDMACEDQVVCGSAAFKVTLDYTYNDVFDQDIILKSIPNPLAVLWDRMSNDVTGRDARHCFEIDEIPRREYEEQWPDQPIPANFGGIEISENWMDPATWNDKDTVKIVAFWQMVERPAQFAMMVDGQVEDVTNVEFESYAHRVAVDPNGAPFVRDGVRPFAVRHLVTSFAILDGPYELPLTRLPIIRVSGRVGRVGTQQVRFGLVRWARDPSLLRNYWRSTAAETLAMAPKNQWLATAGSVEGREDDFRKAHLSGDPLLVFNDGAVPPARMDPPNLPTAVLQEANINAQDIKDTTGIQDASLGIRSNEVSGKAIMARQREGDVATITYHDNLNESIQEAGDVVNQLIPITYDTMRTTRITGEDDKMEMVVINDPQDENSPDLTTGKYDVMVITGPSYTTQRMEAAESMMQAIQVFPQLMEVAGDLIVEAQDWPGAAAIAERLKKMIPAAQEDKKPEEMTPEEIQAAEQAAQQAAQQQELQQMAIQAEVRKGELEIEKMEAEAAEAREKAEQAAARTRREKAEADQAEIQIDIDRETLRKATADAQVAEDNVQFNAAQGVLKVKNEAEKPQTVQAPNNKASGPRPKARPAPQQRKTK